MRISVLLTGGTIGSVQNGSFISPSESLCRELGEFFDKASAHHSFRFFEPVRTLSECMTPEKLNRIIDCARLAAPESDALIITHGTDSLAYSAAALSYALYDLEIPSVLVSSSHILSNPRANGLDNLSDALRFIEVYHGGGVFVSYNGTIHYGTRLCPPVAYTDRCKSVLDMDFGRLRQGSFSANPDFIFVNNACTPYKKLCCDRRIFTVPALPDFCYDSIECDAVLQLCYHSGTIDTQNKSFIRFCKRLKNQGTPIFLHGSYPGAEYESKAVFDDLGITVLPIMSAAAAYMKLMITDFRNICAPLCNDIIESEAVTI